MGVWNILSPGIYFGLGVLKHSVPWDIFWSGGLRLLKHFEPKVYKDFELHQVFILNWFKYFETFYPKNIRKENSDMIFCPKMFQYPHIVYYRHTLLQPLSKIRFYIFFSFSDMQKFDHLLVCHAIDINWLLISFLSALHFSNLICPAKKTPWLDWKLKQFAWKKSYSE